MKFETLQSMYHNQMGTQELDSRKRRSQHHEKENIYNSAPVTLYDSVPFLRM